MRRAVAIAAAGDRITLDGEVRLRYPAPSVPAASVQSTNAVLELGAAAVMVGWTDAP